MYRNDGTSLKGNCIELIGTEGICLIIVLKLKYVLSSRKNCKLPRGITIISQSMLGSFNLPHAEAPVSRWSREANLYDFQYSFRPYSPSTQTRDFHPFQPYPRAKLRAESNHKHWPLRAPLHFGPVWLQLHSKSTPISLCSIGGALGASTGLLYFGEGLSDDGDDCDAQSGDLCI